MKREQVLYSALRDIDDELKKEAEKPINPSRWPFLEMIVTDALNTKPDPPSEHQDDAELLARVIDVIDQVGLVIFTSKLRASIEADLPIAPTAFKAKFKQYLRDAAKPVPSCLNCRHMRKMSDSAVLGSLLFCRWEPEVLPSAAIGLERTKIDGKRPYTNCPCWTARAGQ